MGAKPNTVSLWVKILCTNYLLSHYIYIWILIFSCFIICFQSIYLFICPIVTCTSLFSYCPVLTSVVSPRSWRNQFHGMENNKDFIKVGLTLFRLSRLTRILWGKGHITQIVHCTMNTLKIPHLKIAHLGGNLEVGNIKIHHYGP